jgi:oligopeptide/dipeptide ABC transporter ATP-binding protein
VVNLLMDLQESLGLTYVFIAHDLAVVRQIATRTAVMYLGRIVETGPTADLFAQPLHPYTASLLASIPGTHAAPNLHGEPPSPTNPPPGCHFHPRCPRAQASCREQAPALGPLGGGREVACYFPL